MRTLFIILLLTTWTSKAQETFSKKYTRIISVKNHVKGKPQETNVTVIFNTQGINDIVFYFPSGYKNTHVRRYRQVTEKRYETNSNNEKYQIVECVDESDNQIALQLFEDDTRLRLITADGFYVELNRTL